MFTFFQQVSGFLNQLWECWEICSFLTKKNTKGVVFLNYFLAHSVFEFFQKF